MISEDTETTLVGALRSSMTVASNILVINCVDPTVQMFEHSLPSLKFCASVRDQVQKKLSKMNKDKAQKTHKQVDKNNKNFLNMLSSHIKNSERLMDQIKRNLHDIEFQLLQNPQDQQLRNQCHQYKNQLDDVKKDFNTLIEFSEKMPQQNSIISLVESSNQTIIKICYLQQKIGELLMPKDRSSHERLNSVQYDPELNSLQIHVKNKS